MKADIITRRLNIFEKRFGKPHLYLAYHAAFPLALTPELMYRVWANFQRDIKGEPLNIPWVAVGDFLLSSLCDEVGHELYEMDMAVRNEMLKRLKSDEKFGIKRIEQLSDFLLEYVRQQILSDDPDTQNFAKTLHWTALAYTKPTEAARQIALTFRHLELLSSRQNQKNRTELVRMASLVETFAEPLVEAELEPLVTYARGMTRFAHDDIEGAANHIGKVAEAGKIQVAGVDIPIPEKIQENLDAKEAVGNDFSGQNLQGRSFKGQNLIRANFSRSDIRSADFTNANLTGANFSDAKAGLHQLWVIGLVLCAFLLAALSGLATAFVGWIIGWEFNNDGISQGIGIATLVAIVAVLAATTFRNGIKNTSGAFALSATGTGAIAAFELLTLYGVLPEAIRALDSGILASAFVGGVAIITVLTIISHRRRMLALPITLIASGIGALLGFAATAWFGLLKNPSIQIILANLAITLLIASVATLVVAIAAIWNRNAAIIGITTTILFLAIWCLFATLGFLNNTWMKATLLSILAVGLTWAIVVTLTLAINLVLVETENILFAKIWTFGALLFSNFILLLIILLGSVHIYPQFRIIEDILFILALFIAIIGFQVLIIQRIKVGNNKFIAFYEFAKDFATTAGTTFRGANLMNANFTNSTVKYVNFSEANLTQACWLNAKKLDYASTKGTYLSYLQIRQLVTTRTGQDKIFDNMDLQGINLQGVNLVGASFIGANLVAANLQDADLSKAKLIQTELDQANLSGACLTGAYIQNSHITTATKVEDIRCDYIFTKLPTQDNPDAARQPESWQKTFSPKEFTDFIQTLISDI